jgi:N-acetylglucosamine malate deacetylase 1
MKKRKVLVIAAHPDDEILGCGGSIAFHVNKGDEVSVVFMSDGVTSRKNKEVSLNEIDKRKRSALGACAILGAQEPYFLDLPDNQMDTHSILEITQKLERVIDKIKPEIVYTHHGKDLNIDHQLTYLATMTACRPQPESFVYEIYSFEILSSTGWGSPTMENIFLPNVFIDITTVFEKKMEAIHYYRDELRPSPHARSYDGIESLAKYRGMSVGVKYSEAFQLQRKIIV